MMTEKCISRTCDVCGEKMYSPSNEDRSGFIKHCEDNHPNYFLSDAKRVTFLEKKYFNPITQKWYNTRKFLAKSVKECGLTNEEYYIKYGKEYMPEEWKNNTSDPILGDARNHNRCIECGKIVQFRSCEWKYAAFCYNSSCNVNYYNKNTNRHGRAGVEISKNRESGDVVPNQVGYWLKKGYSQEESEQRVRERQQTNTLERFILRYGEVEGPKRWAARQVKWLESMRNSGMYSGYSFVSEQLFDMVAKYYPTIRYGETEMVLKLGKYVRKPDCVLPGTKLVVEFFGDYYHRNPTKYSPTSKVTFGHKDKKVTLESSDVWMKDQQRIDLFNEHGYDVLVVWETDFYKDPNQVIKKCLDHFSKSNLMDLTADQNNA